MTGNCRLPILAIAAILIAGCGATPASSPDPSTAAAPPTSMAESPAQPSPTTLPRPSSGKRPPPTSDYGFVCAAVTESYVPPPVGLEIGTGMLMTGVRVEVTRIEPVGRSGHTWTGGPGDPAASKPGVLVGDREHQLGLFTEVYDDFDVPYHFISVDVVLHREGRAPRQLDVHPGVHPNSGREIQLLSVPDITGAGTIEVDVSWSDPCFTYRAVGSRDVRLVGSAITGQCPSSDRGFYRYATGLLQPPPEIGGVPFTPSVRSTMGRWTEYAVAVDGPVLQLWNPDLSSPVVAGGSTVEIKESNADLRFTELHASFYRRRDVIDWLESETSIKPVLRRHPDVAADGTFGVRVPADPGRYIVELLLGWDSPCASGDSVAVVGIDVE